MIHYATVHWQDDRWVDVQLAYLRRHSSEPHRTYAFLNGLPADHTAKFDHASTEDIRQHAIKLNLLADVICHAADDPDDLLVFVDGDAFPITDFAPRARELLPRHHLLAVQRLENNGDPQPHPCFCVTTVGFWQEIRGDWKRGHAWVNPQGESVTDVGGNLLFLLTERGTPWLPLLRTNRTNLHPLMFAVYGGLAYHHGGGFRLTGRGGPVSRGGRVARLAAGEAELARRPLSRLLDLLPHSGLGRRLRERHHPVLLLGERLRRETAELSEQVFARIVADPEFWHEFADADQSAE